MSLMFAPAFATAASLDVYLSAPGAQSTYVTGAATETFDRLPLGLQMSPFQSAIGTYEFSPTSRMAVVAADQLGGANGSNYISLGTQSASSSPVTLQLNRDATYFGFWWSAGDAKNGLSFYYNNILVGNLTTPDLVALLQSNSGTVTAANGSQYAASSYYGNPNNGGDSKEPFAYVNVFAQGTAFNRVVFSNSGSMATGFETDNHSVYVGALEPQGASVYSQSAPALSSAPEPGQLAFVGASLLGLVLFRRRKQS